LARIVTNVFLDEVRRKRRRPVDVLPDDPGRVLPPAPAADEVPTGLSAEVQQALAALPEDFRVPVVLCDVSDLSSADRRNQGTIGTVRSRIHRGRRMLRARTAEGDGPPQPSLRLPRRGSRPTARSSERLVASAGGAELADVRSRGACALTGAPDWEAHRRRLAGPTPPRAAPRPRARGPISSRAPDQHRVRRRQMVRRVAVAAAAAGVRDPGRTPVRRT
jgi:hypothetical protein